MQTAHRRLTTQTSPRHTLRNIVIVIAMIAVAAAYFGGVEGTAPAIDPASIIDSIFG
jgi:hypothetical protein